MYISHPGLDLSVTWSILPEKIQCTKVRFSHLFSCGFITAIVANPPERKLAKHTSVQWGEGPILLIGSSDTLDPCFVKSQSVETHVSISKVNFYRKLLFRLSQWCS